MTQEQALDILAFRRKEFQLDGVELTREDAEYMLALMAAGKTSDEASAAVLNGIYEVLKKNNLQGAVK